MMNTATTLAKSDAVDAARTEIVQLGRASLVVLPPTEPGEPASTALIKMGDDGLVRWVRTEVQLSEAAQHTYQIPDGRGGKTTNISAAGFDHINRAMSVGFFMPETIAGEDDSGRHRNPQVIRDENGVCKRVIIRCIGFGRNAGGNWQAHDSTLYYDLEPCLAQDVIKAWRGWDKTNKRKGDGADWGQMLSSENVPEEIRKDPTKKCIPIPGGYVLACKLQGPMLDVIDAHAHRVRFAPLKAETIVKRNILKRFVGRQRLGKSLTVTVVSWQQPDRAHVDQVARLITEVQGGSFKIDGEPVEVHTDSQTVDTPEGEAAAGGYEEAAHIIDPDAEPSEPSEPAAGMVSQPVMSGGPAAVTNKPAATREQAQAAVAKGTVSGAVVEARDTVKRLWAELGGDKPTTNSGERETACWTALTACGFETINEALATSKAAWIGQLVAALEEIQLKRASAAAQAKRPVPPEETGPPPAADGGSPAMQPKGDPPPAGRLFTDDTGRAHGDPG